MPVPSMAELRAVAGPSAQLLSDEDLRRAYLHAQALRRTLQSMGLDPARIARLVIEAQNAGPTLPIGQPRVRH